MSPASGRDDIEPGGARAQFAQARLTDPDPGVGAIARSSQTVDIGLGNEAFGHQLLGAIEIGLRQPRIGLRDLDLRALTRLLLDLHRTVDHRQRLALADPLPGVDQHRGDLAAITGNAPRAVRAAPPMYRKR